jgi:hypothetical protein
VECAVDGSRLVHVLIDDGRRFLTPVAFLPMFYGVRDVL